MTNLEEILKERPDPKHLDSAIRAELLNMLRIKAREEGDAMETLDLRYGMQLIREERAMKNSKKASTTKADAPPPPSVEDL